MTILNPCTESDDLGGGRFRNTHYLKPVAHMRNGAWLRINNRLGNTGDPSLPWGVDELLQFRLRDRLSGNAPVLHFGKGNTHVRMTPLGTANISGVAVGDNSFRYNGAWNGADLEFLVGGHIVRKNIYLRAGHPAQFQFRIDDHIGLNLDTMQTPDFRVHDPVLLGPNDESIGLVWGKSVQGGKTILTAVLPPDNFAGWVLDPTLSLQPDSTAGLDTQMIQSAATTNYGTTAVLQVGEPNDVVSDPRRMLIKFDLTDLPAAAVISSVTFSLYCTTDRSDNARTFRVYRQLKAWTEAGATWNKYDGVSDWTTAGGFDAADCEQTDIGSRAFTATETLNEFKDFALTPVSKSALENGNGWLIRADTEADDAYRFVSSDGVNAANRPTLVVVYTVAGNPYYAYAQQ